MSYPRLITLDTDTEANLRQYINNELFNHYAERSAWIDDLKKWQRDYWAEPVSEKKTFPFTGASNVIIPLSAISVEAIHARVMTSLFAFGDNQFVAAEAISDDFVDTIAPLESYLDDLLLNKMNFRSKIESTILEWEKLGTGCAKAGYKKIVRKAIRSVGDREEDFEVTVYDNATADSVSIAKFLMPFSSQDPQSAPWVGEEMTMTAYEVKAHATSGLFYSNTYNQLDAYFNAQYALTNTGLTREYERQQESLEQREPIFPKWLDFVELWLAFDVDNDGKDEEIVVHYHQPSGTFMSIRYNWHADLHRPYRAASYIKVEHRWAGIGIGKQVQQFLREITTIHRQRLDNATLANTRMLKVNRLSGYGPGEPIFPGKLWFLDDMTHLEPIQMSEVYESSFQNEQSALIYAQQRTGVNEVTLGMPQVGTPGTATSDLTRVQEGSRKFDYCYQNIKGLINSIIIDVACNQQQFGPKTVAYLDKMENGELVKTFFSFPETYIRDGALIRIRSAGQQDNKILNRQNWQQIGMLFQQYGQAIFQLPLVQGNPQLSNILQVKILAGATEAMRQMLETFDIRNIDRVLPLKEIEALVKNALGPMANSNGTTGISEMAPTGAGSNIPPFLSQMGGTGPTTSNGS